MISKSKRKGDFNIQKKWEAIFKENKFDIFFDEILVIHSTESCNNWLIDFNSMSTRLGLFYT